MGKYLIGLVVFLGLASCTQWPKPSTGGYAAHYLFTPAYQRALLQSPKLSFLSQKLAALIRQRKALNDSHVFRCYPGRKRLILLLEQQIAQEISAGLIIATHADLALYDNILRDTIRLNKNKGCPRRLKNDCWTELKMRFIT